MDSTTDPRKRSRTGRACLNVATVLAFGAVVISGTFPVAVTVLAQLSGEGSEEWRPRAWISSAGLLALGFAPFSSRRVGSVLSFLGVGALAQYILFAAFSRSSSIHAVSALPFSVLSLLQIGMAAMDWRKPAS